MKLLSIFYRVKPFIPRRLQIEIRRRLAFRKRQAYQDVWPINRGAAAAPEKWIGWPEQKKFALILCHDVDTAKGHDQCTKLMNMEKELGFKSSFNFVPEDYQVSPKLRQELADAGFEIGVHGLKHDGRLFLNRKIFERGAPKINSYLKDWGAVGFYSPAMCRNSDWISEFNIEYSCSTFDTDPFEPQPNGVGTIFPLWIFNSARARGYVEIPYTLPQDHCLFVILKEKTNTIWIEKLDWIAENGGLVRINTHPDYMNFDGTGVGPEGYSVTLYRDFLEYIKTKYAGQYWHVLPRDLAAFWRKSVIKDERIDHPVKFVLTAAPSS
jgi:peptidoglycan/xylan/chitin deacetylase (PgdA/CDA1 family)